MEYLKIIGLLASAAFVIDRIGLWMESKGWIYWRKIKSSGGGAGNALQELNSFLNPSVKHVMKIKDKTVKPLSDLENGKDLLPNTARSKLPSKKL